MINLLENVSLKKFNTFGVEAKARYFASFAAYDDLKNLILSRHPAESQHLVIGGGSNLLFTKDFDGWILHNTIKGIEITEETSTEVLIKVGGGETWSNLVDFTVERNWYGLENLSLIPGTVGAAPVQNIGAYGVEQKEAFVQLEACNLVTGKICQFNKLECDFRYRHSIFKASEKGKWMVLNVSYRLQKKGKLHLDYKPLRLFFQNKPADQLTVKMVSEAVKSIRRSKLPDPKVVGNGGSFFKNPVIPRKNFLPLRERFPDIPFYELPNQQIKLAAGWLIEHAGWKGKRMGQAAVHDKQALVLVNMGNAKGIEILNLSKAIQSDVYNQFGIRLEPEVLLL
jgi:UDP-N-acetylmuramate dehydrogenase